jgi:uncharacterized delta-60 repeat protein
LLSIALTTVVWVNEANAQYGALDLSFNPDPAVQGVNNLAVQPDGKVLLYGWVQIGGTYAVRLVRLTETGALDASFVPQVTTSEIMKILVQSDGRIIVAGSLGTPTEPSAPRVVRLQPDGTLDTSFASSPSANAPLNCAALMPDGGVLVAGFFTNYAGVPRARVARLLPSGALDPAFSPGQGIAGLNASVYDCVVQPDGRSILAGSFLTYDGAPRRCLVRINANGSVDSSFSVGQGTYNFWSPGYIAALALEPSGHVWIGGEFQTYFNWNTNGSNGITRIKPDGTPASFNGSGTYEPFPQDILWPVGELAIQPNGLVLVGGVFPIYNGANVGGFVRVGSNGTRDTSFSPALIETSGSPGVNHIALMSDGRAVVSGSFSSYNGVPRNNFARIFTYSCYADGDGDGFGAGNPIPGNAPCSGALKILGTDCDDTNPAVRPGGTEVCNGIDDDCDSVIDEGFISTYCTAGTTVAGCVPAIRGEGAPSSQATSGFDVVVDNVPTQKMGLIFYGLNGIPSPQPWALGSTSYLCIFYPVNRTGAQNSGGSVGACDGELRIDFNAWRTANPTALGAPFTAGQVLYAQGWFRDAGAAKGTNLSDGLRFTLCD